MSLPGTPEPDNNAVVEVKWLHPSIVENSGPVVKWLYPNPEGSESSSDISSEFEIMADDPKDPTKDLKDVKDLKDPKDPKDEAISTTDDDEIDVGEEIQAISKEVTAAASYFGSMVSSAFTKTAMKASEATANVKASGILAAIGGPIKPEDDVAEAVKADEVPEKVEPLPPPAPRSNFFGNAWSAMTKSTSWVGVVPEQDKNSENSAEGGDASNAAEKAGDGWTGWMSSALQRSTTMLSEFNKEQEKFMKEKAKENGGVGCSAPWVGYEDEEAVRTKILALSEDKRTFVRAPPSGVVFDFQYESVAAEALIMLREDPNLSKMRYDLVPKAVKEDDFWKNYFYRVSLIKQSHELKEFEEKSNDNPTESAKERPPVEPRLAPSAEEDLNNQSNTADPEDEFVSETYQASAKDMAEVDESMKRLGVGKTPTKGEAGGGGGDEEWEAELEGELNEFEVVSSRDSREESPEWESQIQELLDAEDTTAKDTTK